MAVGSTPATTSVRRISRLAMATIVFLGGGIGLLAATTKISGAVIAEGTLVADSYTKPVEHLKGGIVDSVNVKNGDLVKAGDILIRLDDTQIKASLSIISKRSNELTARIARLRAELDGESVIQFPANFRALADEYDIVDLIAGESRLFAERMASRTGRELQLRQTIGQLEKQVEGLEAQAESKRRQISLLSRELAVQQKLLQQGAISGGRVFQLEQDEAGLSGELGALTARIAETRGKISETELQIIQIEDDWRSEVSDALQQALGDVGEYQERLAAVSDELARVDIRASQSGIVHQLSVHVRGTVVAPGETLAQIVPDADLLTAEIRLSPRDIDQVVIGQRVVLRFSAFASPGTPDVNAEISHVSPDLTVDPSTGVGYYLVRATVSPQEWRRLNRRAVPGMPVEVFVQTGSQPVLAYFAKPLTDQMNRAFKEE